MRFLEPDSFYFFFHDITMPWVVRKSKGKRRPRVQRKRMYRRKGVRRATGGGFLVVRRKLPLATINATGLVGVATVNDAGLGTHITLGTIVPSLGKPSGYYDVPFSLMFAFNQQTNSTEFTNLFDQYKIKYGTVRVQNNGNISGTQSGGILPYIEYVQDHDDNTPPPAADFRERMGIKTAYFSSSRVMIKMGVSPKPATTLYNTLVSSGYGVPGKAPWINTSNPAVPHYGIKGVIRSMWLPNGSNQAILTFDSTLHHMVKDIQ